MIYCLGISHQTAPVSLRERLACRLDDLIVALPEDTAVCELVLLSTCNRIEIYAEIPADSPPPKPFFLSLLAQAAHLTLDEFAEHTYAHSGDAAVNHLLRVVSGLDSIVLGEPQILGQITKAHMTAVSQKTSGSVLNALFQTATRTGKRVHSETSISSNPVSISSVAIALAQNALGDLSDRQVLVVGAGEMGRLAVKALRNRNLRNIHVANRTISRAESIVSESNGRAYALDQLPRAIAEADVVITAAHSQTPLIHAGMIEERERPLILVDIAVPRNISPDVRSQPQVRLFDVDDLQTTLDESLAARQAEIPKVEAIIDQEQQNFQTVLRQLTIKPVIVEMRRKAEEIREAEMARTMRYLGDLDPQAIAHIQHFSRSLINKLLHDPTIRLRQAAQEDGAEDFVGTVRNLFRLEQ
jgi:glutamyl-tRNA reductase